MTKSLFLTEIANKMRVIRYAKRTIETYLHWIRAFIIFMANSPLRILVMSS